MSKSFKFKFLFSALVVLVFNGLTTPANATTYACNNFPTQLCAPISTVSLSIDSGKTLVSNSTTTFVSTKITKLNFQIDAGSSNATKAATIQFFDISAGLKLLVRSNATSSCAAGNTIQKECAITLDSDGKKSFYLSLFDVEPGMHFQFKYVGPEAWTSATKSVTFSIGGKIPQTPEACVSNNTQICGPVTNLSFQSSGKLIKTSKPDKNGNFTSKIPANTEILKFTYKSSPAYAFKYFYVDFFNLTSGLNLIVDTSTNTTGAGCDRSVANSRGCYMQLNSKGSGSFLVLLSSNAAGKSFSFKLNGPSYTSKYVVVNLVSKK